MSNMKTFTSQCAQGDLLLTRIDTLPGALKEMKAENKKYIVAHSETGHHHTIAEQEGVIVYEAANDEFALYLVVDNPTVLRHERSFNTHEPIEIDKGIYRINRQREYTPEGFRRAAD